MKLRKISNVRRGKKRWSLGAQADTTVETRMIEDKGVVPLAMVISGIGESRISALEKIRGIEVRSASIDFLLLSLFFGTITQAPYCAIVPKNGEGS